MSQLGPGPLLSRRQLVVGGTAAGLGAFMFPAGMVFSQETMEFVESKPYEALLPTLPRGGTGIYAFTGAEPAHLDPQLSRAGRIQIITDTLNDWLVRYDLDGNLVPSLASSVEMVDDQTMRFTLRSGVQFHNGRQLTAEDVKWTIEHAQNPDSLSVYAKEMEVVTAIETPSPDVVVFHLAHPAPVFIHSLTRMGIVPREVIEEQGDMRTNPVGCGPFRLKEWRSGESIEVERFADYWDPEAPRLDSILFRFIADERSTVASFEAGEIHCFRGFGMASHEQLTGRDAEGIHSIAQPSIDWGYLAFNHTRAPFDDVRVRRAISLALDRSMFNEVAHNNVSALSWFPVPNESPLYPADLEEPRNIELARELLAEAGYPDGFESTILVSSFPLEQPYGILLQAQLSEIGIQLQIEELELGAFLARVFTDKDYDMTMLSDAGSPDPATFLNNYYLSDGGSNITGYNSPEMDELLIAASSTIDEEVRADLYRQAFELMVEDAPMPIILMYSLVIAWRDPFLGQYVLSNPENFRNNWPAVAMEQE